MARLDTKTKLSNYIRSQLGQPIHNVEVTDEQISEIIDDSIQKFTEYSYGTLEGRVIIELNGMGEYTLPDTITNILKLSRSSSSNVANFGGNFGNGYVPNIWSEQFFSGSLTGNIIPAIMSISSTTSMLDKFFGDDLNFNFNANRKIIQLHENYSGAVLLYYQYEYIADEVDMIYNHEWIKAYSKAKVKELWGGNVGKFDQSLVGGARLNYDRLISEAQQEIAVLDEQLITKWSDPAPISVA